MPICKECKKESTEIKVPVLSIMNPNFQLPRKFHVNHGCCPSCYIKVFGDWTEFTFIMKGFIK